jgi:hypothetical protein
MLTPVARAAEPNDVIAMLFGVSAMMMPSERTESSATLARIRFAHSTLLDGISDRTMRNVFVGIPNLVKTHLQSGAINRQFHANHYAARKIILSTARS